MRRGRCWGTIFQSRVFIRAAGRTRFKTCRMGSVWRYFTDGNNKRAPGHRRVCSTTGFIMPNKKKPQKGCQKQDVVIHLRSDIFCSGLFVMAGYHMRKVRQLFFNHPYQVQIRYERALVKEGHEMSDHLRIGTLPFVMNTLKNRLKPEPFTASQRKELINQ